MISVQYGPEDDCGRKNCPNNGRYTSHYHCPHPECTDPAPTSMLGHFIGGDRPDARRVCDPVERRAYARALCYPPHSPRQ